MYCKKCRVFLPEGTRFCFNCFAKVDAPEQNAEIKVEVKQDDPVSYVDEASALKTEPAYAENEVESIPENEAKPVAEEPVAPVAEEAEVKKEKKKKAKKEKIKKEKVKKEKVKKEKVKKEKVKKVKAPQAPTYAVSSYKVKPQPVAAAKPRRAEGPLFFLSLGLVSLVLSVSIYISKLAELSADKTQMLYIWAGVGLVSFIIGLLLCCRKPSNKTKKVSAKKCEDLAFEVVKIVPYAYDTAVSCVIRNISGKASAKCFKNVRVQARFFNESGLVIHTDTTWAVGDMPLLPGENETFGFMVPIKGVASVELALVSDDMQLLS